MIALPEKFNARTPNNNIPPPNPIMEEIKEEIKLDIIIKITEKNEIPLGNDKIVENISLFIRFTKIKSLN